MAACRMATNVIVITVKFADEIIEKLLTEDQEIVQAFLLDALDDPFGFENFVEAGREFRVAVAYQISRLFIAIGGVHQKVARLLRDPLGIGMRRGVADEDLAGLDVDEDQQEIVYKTPRCDDALCEKITGPERLGVHLNELFPGSLGTFGRGVDLHLFEGVANRLPTDAIDPKPPQLSQDACVADAGFAGNLTDQLAEHLSLSGASRLGWLGVNIAGDVGARNCPLFLQILDVLGQSVFRGIRDEQQQRVKRPGHPAPVCDFTWLTLPL